MTNNDALMVSFKILSYLKKTLEEGQKVSLDILNGVTIGINEVYLSSVMDMLEEKGYIKGLIKNQTKDGTFYMYQGVQITLDGIEYLEENTTMKKAYKVAKELKDWIPFL
jgi:hypothetical protein